jgi:hypothetical protein
VSTSLVPPTAAAASRAAAPTDPAPGALRPVSRAGVLLLLVLAVANGVWLYLLPGRAEEEYAWSIVPAINAAFLGAGYLAGTVATALVVFGARRWRSLRVLPLPLVVLSAALLAATLIHEDRFKWDYAPTWVWTIVYLGVPPVVAALWWLQERDAPPAPPRDPRLTGMLRRSAALGAVLLLVGAVLFAVPAEVAEIWPWPITPLLGRALGAWFLLVGCALLVSARTIRTAHEVPIPYATLLAWSLLLALLPALHADDLAGRDGALVAFLALMGLLCALAVEALARAVRALRAAEERL